MYPGVTLDVVDFAAGGMPHGWLGYAHWYDVRYPVSHERGLTVDLLRQAVKDKDDVEHQELKDEAALAWGENFPVCDLGVTGTIHLGSGLSRWLDPPGELVDKWFGVRRKTPDAPAGLEVSMPAYTLVHEFGHLVDSAVRQAGECVTRDVYGHMSAAVLGLRGKPDASRWSTHLWNYPVHETNGPGPAAGGAARAKQARKALRDPLKSRLGPNATVDRNELFAEFFSAVTVCDQPELQPRWRSCQRRLAQVGVAR
jgi:hypothetical protein